VVLAGTDEAAQRLIQLMRRLTPADCPKPARNAANRAFLTQWIEAEPFEELEDHVRLCARSIELGLQDKRWWYVQNVFGSHTYGRWEAEYMSDDFKRRDAAKKEARNQAQLEVARSVPAEESTPIADLQLRRIIASAKKAMAPRLERNKDDGDSETGTH
jgi:hypothetical protein